MSQNLQTKIITGTILVHPIGIQMVISLGGPDIQIKTPEIPEKIQIPPINQLPRGAVNTDSSGVMSLLHGVPLPLVLQPKI